MATLKKQVLEALSESKEDPALLVCYWQALGKVVGPCSVEELPEREYDSGFGSLEGERFLGFSERYVYFRNSYDGSQWIDFVPRSPAFIPDRLPNFGDVWG